MKAVVITAPGGPEVLDIREVPNPPPANDGQVLVRVHASALNRADILQRQGRYPAPPGFPPDIPGLEFAGEVADVGANVSQWNSGDRVFGITGGGAQAQYLLAPANHLAAIPSNLDWTKAAAVPEVFITAHDALFTQASLQPNETVLIHAAGSGVGTAAIQLATANHATAFGTARSSDKLERAKEFGLANSIAIKRDPLEVVEAVREWTNGRGVDVILDSGRSGLSRSQSEVFSFAGSNDAGKHNGWS
jgi:NADPH2:quinone reductase